MISLIKNAYKILPLAFVGLLLAVLVAMHFILLIPGPDAGIFMYGGMLISRGYLPYRDLWDNKPPLIYCIGAIGYLYRANPFLLVRVLETLILLFNLWLVHRVTDVIDKGKSVYYVAAYCILYLIFWDSGFLTETFTIPLTLIGAYAYVKNSRRLPFILTLLWWAVFMLKPNAMVVLTLLIVADIYNHRTAFFKRILSYVLAFITVGVACYFFLYSFGVFNNYAEQVFIYKKLYAGKMSVKYVLLKQLFQPHFEIIFISILAYVFTSAKATSKPGKSYLVPWTVVAFILAYLSGYATGKNFNHYFLLCIIPAANILGYMAASYPVYRIVLLGLGAIGLYNSIIFTKKYEEGVPAKRHLLQIVKNNSPAGSRIYYAGKGHSYLYVLSNRLSHSKYIEIFHSVTPFTEAWYTNSSYGDSLKKDLTKSAPELLIIPQDSLTSSAMYYQAIRTLLPQYDSLTAGSGDIVYKVKKR